MHVNAPDCGVFLSNKKKKKNEKEKRLQRRAFAAINEIDKRFKQLVREGDK